MVVRERRRKTSRKTRYNTRRQNRVRKRQSNLVKKRLTKRRRKTNKMNRKRGKRSYKKYSRERIIQEGGMKKLFGCSDCGAKSRRTSPESMTEEQRRQQSQYIRQLGEAEERMRQRVTLRRGVDHSDSYTSPAFGPPKRNSTQPSVKKSKKSKKKEKTQGNVVRESGQREEVSRIQARMPGSTEGRYSQRSTRQSTNAESTNSKPYGRRRLQLEAARRSKVPL